MSEQKLTHYRKVYKSDHLGVADIEDFLEAGSDLIFTIKCVCQEMNAKVAGKKISANIAYFVEPIKPMVLNATNAATLRTLSNSGYIENWANLPIQFYIDKNVKMMNEVVGGIRIRNKLPRLHKRIITPQDAKMWGHAKSAYKRDGNFNAILEKAEISEDNMLLIMQEVDGNV